MKKIEFTKVKRSDIDEIVDMFRYTIKEMNANGIPQWDEIFTEEKKKELYVEQKKSGTVVKGPKIGRNDPCPCGSGKKYKHCCGKNK